MPMSGISFDTPSDPCTCMARHTMSLSTFAVATFTPAISLPRAVTTALVAHPCRVQHLEAELVELDPRVGDVLLDELLVGEQ